MLGKSVLVDGLSVHYKIAGEGSPLLILHGWGSSSISWAEFQDSLSLQGFQVIVPDLPGFGLSAPPATVWGIAEYTALIFGLAEKLGLQKFSLAGHSFGGQIAIQFAASHPEKIEKLILLAAAGIRKEPGKEAETVRFVAKFFNFFLSPIPSEGLKDFVRRICCRFIGRQDYAKTKGIMREVMAKVIREDLTHIFAHIKAPTLIIWGDKDKITPLEDAFVMKKHIKNSYLGIFPGAGHRIRAEAPKKLAETMVTFLRQ